MLDTNMVSYIIKGKSPAARARLAGLSQDEIACISAIRGRAALWASKVRSRRVEPRRKSLEWFLARLKVHSWGREAAAAYDPLRAKQSRWGRLAALSICRLRPTRSPLEQFSSAMTKHFSMYPTCKQSRTGRRISRRINTIRVRRVRFVQR